MPGGEVQVRLEGVSHYFGDGAIRKQILYDIETEIRAGEIVIVTGPSGSGKTTVLTLVGALRTVQEGSLKVLGHELRGADTKAQNEVRKRIGYIFQSHNLLDALTATENVQMAVELHPETQGPEARERAQDILKAVGLGDRLDHHPRQLSGGQRQRVAIARALASEPRIILADEPTASLDKKSGRDVVELMQNLARERGVTVILVTHDNRILDIADRILHMEDGRLTSFTDAVASNTRQMLETLAHVNRQGELSGRLRDMPVAEFANILGQATAEAQQLVQSLAMANNNAFQSMLEQALHSFTLKFGQILEADRATLLLVDEAKRELWSKVAQAEGEAALEIRVPMGTGVAGHVASTGKSLNIPDAYEEPLFDQSTDKRTGYRTRSILCVPILNPESRVFAVAQLLNKRGGEPFESSDEQKLTEFAAQLGPVLESWWLMTTGAPSSS